MDLIKLLCGGSIMKDEDFLCGITKEFWNYYFMEPTEDHFHQMLSYFSSSLVMIGTGKHEFFTDIKQIFTNMNNILVEEKTIIFDVIDEWYECKRISDDTYLVYGGIWVRQK